MGVPPRQGKGSKQRIRGQEQRMKALTLRRAGASYERIGQAMGISAVMAHRHVMHALADLKPLEQNLAEEIRSLQLQQLDEMQASIYAAALNPEPIIEVVDERQPDGTYLRKPVQIGVHRERQLKVIDRVARLQERREALIAGLAAPKRLEQSGPGGGPIPVKTETGPFDLDKLTPDQLRAYREIVAAATGSGPASAAEE